jgi:hypothetical protein
LRRSTVVLCHFGRRESQSSTAARDGMRRCFTDELGE